MPKICRRTSPFVLAVFVIWCVLTNSVVTGAIQYTVTDMATPEGIAVDATSINNHGQVACLDHPIDQYYRSFVYDGTAHNIGTLDGGQTIATAINNAGQVVGYSDTADGVGAFLYDGTMHYLGSLGGSYSYASGINEAGQVVGHSYLADFNPDHAFFYDGTMHDLGVLGGEQYAESWANGINSHGQIVGASYTSDLGVGAEYHAFLYDGTGMHDLTPGTGIFSEARAINDAGQVTGFNNAGHAFLYDGTMHDLGTLPSDGTDSYALGEGINSAGQIVGQSYVGPIDTHAFLYDGVSMKDLNSLIDPSSGWTLLDATSINDVGQIVGQGRYNGDDNYRAFLLTPVPEPSGFALAALAALSLVVVRRNRKTRKF